MVFIFSRWVFFFSRCPGRAVAKRCLFFPGGCFFFPGQGVFSFPASRPVFSLWVFFLSLWVFVFALPGVYFFPRRSAGQKKHPQAGGRCLFFPSPVFGFHSSLIPSLPPLSPSPLPRLPPSLSPPALPASHAPPPPHTTARAREKRVRRGGGACPRPSPDNPMPMCTFLCRTSWEDEAPLEGMCRPSRAAEALFFHPYSPMSICTCLGSALEHRLKGVFPPLPSQTSAGKGSVLKLRSC